MDIFVSFIGKANCGKGTQAEILAKKYDLKIISSGNILRKWIESDPENYIVKRIKDDMLKGELIPASLAYYSWFREIYNISETQGVAFEGGPRLKLEAEAAIEFFSWLGQDKYFVVYLNISDDESLNRSLSRRICPVCQKTYSLALNPNLTNCPDDNIELSTRPDDIPNVVKNRIDEFNEKVMPAIEYFKEKGVLLDIDGIGSIEEVALRIDNAIQNKINLK